MSRGRLSARAPSFWPGLWVSVLGVSALLALAACQDRPRDESPAADAAPRLILEPSDFGALPGWQGDDLSQALPALRRSCESLLRQPDERAVGPDGLAGTVGDWRSTCETLASFGDGAENTPALRATLERLFLPLAVTNNTNPTGIFTGYYESELRGARLPDATYRWPIYRRPADLLSVDLGLFRADLAGETVLGRVEGDKLVPYHNRAAIDGPDLAGDALVGRGLELLWLDDPADAFFLHIQGSGRVKLPDGQVTRVGYAGSNGHPFTGIGQPHAGGRHPPTRRRFGAKHHGVAARQP